jgi:hypothetical protein
MAMIIATTAMPETAYETKSLAIGDRIIRLQVTQQDSESSQI